MADENPFAALDVTAAKTAPPPTFTKTQVNPFAALDGVKEPYDSSEGGLMRTFRDFAAGGTGILKAARNAAGTGGDVMAALNLDPPKSIVIPPTSKEVGDAFSKMAASTGILSPDLAESITPEGKFIEPAAQVAASMFSRSPWQIGAGATAGATGELAARVMEPKNQVTSKDSGWRTGGEALVLAPTLAMSLLKPRDVRALGPGLARLGESKADIQAAIDRAEARSEVAADKLRMTHTSIWNQLPELNPEMKDLRASRFGGPLNKQAEIEREAIQREITPRTNMDRVWELGGRRIRVGSIDPTESLVNILQNTDATATPPLSKIIQQTTSSPAGEVVENAWNLLRLPGKIWKGVQRFAGNQALKSIGESLSTVGAPQLLRDIAGYSGKEHAVTEIMRALMALQGGKAPPPDSRIELPHVGLPKGIKIEIGDTQ